MKSPFARDLFKEQVVLITGGGTGIGLTTARLFAYSGARIIISGRRLEPLHAAQAKIEAMGAPCLSVTCDIREPDDTQSLINACIEKYGQLDILINNAGGQYPSAAEHIKFKGWNAVIRNNLTGTWNMTQAASKCMITRGQGVIINVIADIHRGFPGMAHTGAARAGVENLTKTLSIEWARHNIRVNAVAPGIINTPVIAKYGAQMVEARREEIPAKRLGTALEVASSICFLASPAARYITGETLYVDGGAHLWGRHWVIPEPTHTPLTYDEE